MQDFLFLLGWFIICACLILIMANIINKGEKL